MLYQTVATYWPEFQERAGEDGGLSKFVAREFDEYLRCGILEYGCLAIACDPSPPGQLKLRFDD